MKGAVVLFMQDLIGAQVQADFRGAQGCWRLARLASKRRLLESMGLMKTRRVSAYKGDLQGRAMWRPLKRERRRLLVYWKGIDFRLVKWERPMVVERAQDLWGKCWKCWLHIPLLKTRLEASIEQGGWGSPEGKSGRFCYLPLLSCLFTAIYVFNRRTNSEKTGQTK